MKLRTTWLGIGGAIVLTMGCLDYDLEKPVEGNTHASCQDDADPKIDNHQPGSSSVFADQDSVELEVWVSDAETTATALEVQWLLDGTSIATGVAPDAAGHAVASWDGPRPTGGQTLAVQVTDECGNTDEREISVCQESVFAIEQFDDDHWRIEGSAELQGDTVELTDLEQWEVGSAFLTDRELRADDLHVRFEFQAGDGNGADGMSLTALDTERATGYLGGSGCGLGFGGDTSCDDMPVGPALPGWSLELDTWYNHDIDPTTHDHIAFVFDGQIAAPAAWAPVLELEDSGWHVVEVLVQAPRVTVSIDGAIYIDEELEGAFDFPAHIGFTGATGGETNRHLVRGLEIVDIVCPGYAPDLGEPSDAEFEDPPDGEVSFTTEVSADWVDGYCMDCTVINYTADQVEWEVELLVEGTITEIWDAVFTPVAPNTRFTGVAWNAVLDAGEQTEFVFCADR